MGHGLVETLGDSSDALLDFRSTRQVDRDALQNVVERDSGLAKGTSACLVVPGDRKGHSMAAVPSCARPWGCLGSCIEYQPGQGVHPCLGSPHFGAYHTDSQPFADVAVH